MRRSNNFTARSRVTARLPRPEATTAATTLFGDRVAACFAFDFDLADDLPCASPPSAELLIGRGAAGEGEKTSSEMLVGRKSAHVSSILKAESSAPMLLSEAREQSSGRLDAASAEPAPRDRPAEVEYKGCE